MAKTVAQIIDGDKVLTKLLSEMFLWIGRPQSVERIVKKLADKLRDEHGIEFEIYT